MTYLMSYLVNTGTGEPERAEGWHLRCGAVLHRTLLWGGERDDEWTIGDPVSGAAIVHGGSMGEALRRYRQLRRLHGERWPAVLDQARQIAMARLVAKRRERGEWRAAPVVQPTSWRASGAAGWH